MSAEIIPLKEPVVRQPRCSFCTKEIPKGTMALASEDKTKWMCRGCLQEAYIRMGAAA